MFLIEAPPQITTIQASELFTQIQADESIVNIQAESQVFILFDEYIIPDFASNHEALVAGLDKFDLWRSPDNKINIVKDQKSLTGFNLNLSRALSYLRRLF